MAISGMEQMMVGLLGKMGIDGEQIKNMANGVQGKITEIADRLQAIETKLDKSIELSERIIAFVEPKPDGGFELGDGSPEDIEFRKGMADVLRPLPTAETLEYAQRESLTLVEV